MVHSFCERLPLPQRTMRASHMHRQWPVFRRRCTMCSSLMICWPRKRRPSVTAPARSWCAPCSSMSAAAAHMEVVLRHITMQEMFFFIRSHLCQIVHEWRSRNICLVHPGRLLAAPIILWGGPVSVSLWCSSEMCWHVDAGERGGANHCRLLGAGGLPFRAGSPHGQAQPGGRKPQGLRLRRAVRNWRGYGRDWNCACWCQHVHLHHGPQLAGHAYHW